MTLTRRTLLKTALAAGAIDLTGLAVARAADSSTDTDGLGFQYGDPIRPYNRSWICQPVPSNIYLDPSDNGTVGSEIAAQAALTNPYVNIDGRYSGEPYVVPANAARTPVAVAKGGYHIQAQMKLGVPMPAGATPASSGEPTLTVYQPEYAGKYNRPGMLFELYKWAIDPTTGAVSCENAARYTGVNSDAKAHGYVWTGGPGAAAYATDPDSTYTDQPYITGPSLPYGALVVTLADVHRGRIDHVVGLELVHSHGYVWPGQRSDGVTTTSIVHEGDRVILDAADINPNVHPLNLLLQHGTVEFGMVVSDMSGSVAVRFAPSVATAGYVGATPLYSVLNGFPFGKLKRVSPRWPDGTLVGDSNQIPTS